MSNGESELHTGTIRCIGEDEENQYELLIELNSRCSAGLGHTTGNEKMLHLITAH